MKNELYLRAKCHFENADSFEAIKDLTTLINSNPTISKAFHLRGLAYADVKKHKEAIDDLQRQLS